MLASQTWVKSLISKVLKQAKADGLLGGGSSAETPDNIVLHDTTTVTEIGSVASSTYSNDEVVIGAYFGKPLYRRVIDTTARSAQNTWAVAVEPFDAEIITEVRGITDTGASYSLTATPDGGKVQIMHHRNATISFVKIILEYTKSTD